MIQGSSRVAGKRGSGSGRPRWLPPVLFPADARLPLFCALVCLLAAQFLIHFSVHDLLPQTSLVATSLSGLSLVLILVTSNHRLEPPSAAIAGPFSPTSKLVAIVGLVGLTILARFAILTDLPWRLDGDAAAFAREASSFLGPNPPPILGTGWWGNTNLYFFLQSVVLRIAGYSILGMRLPSAAGGVLGVLFIYLLARSVFGKRTGALSALVLATMPFHLAFSRIGTEVIHVAWLVTACLWLTVEAWRRQSPLVFLLAGIACGFAQYFHPSARFIPLVLVVLLVLLGIWPRDGEPGPQRPRTLIAILLAAAGTLLVYGPMVAIFIAHPDQYLVRIDDVSVFKPGWLANELHQSAWWELLGRKIWQAYFGFFAPTGGSRLWLRAPFLTPVEAALAIFGLGCLWLRSEGPAWFRGLLAFYLLGGCFLAGVMMIDAPAPTRYVIFTPAIAVCAGYGLGRVIDLLGSVGRRSWKGGLRPNPAVGLLAYVVFQLVGYVEREAESLWRYSMPSDKIASLSVRHLMNLPDRTYRVVYLRTQDLYFTAQPVLPFLIRQEGIDIPEGTTYRALAASLRPGLTVILSPSGRIAELEPLRRDFPEARFTELRSDVGEVLAGLLEVRLP